MVRMKGNLYSWPVPKWDQLRKYDHDRLMEKGYTKIWFDTQINDKMRLTLLTLYVKLNGLKLGIATPSGDRDSFWSRHVRWWAGKKFEYGNLEFYVRDIHHLLFDLEILPYMQTPVFKGKYWESIELRFYAALHLKHFDGWPVNQVQAHIDEVGWRGSADKYITAKAHPKVWIPLLVHGLSYSSYKDPYIARSYLLEQGWDPVPLIGVDTSYR